MISYDFYPFILPYSSSNRHNNIICLLLTSV